MTGSAEITSWPNWLGELAGKNRLNLNIRRSLRPREAIILPHSQ